MTSYLNVENHDTSSIIGSRHRNEQLRRAGVRPGGKPSNNSADYVRFVGDHYRRGRRECPGRRISLEQLNLRRTSKVGDWQVPNSAQFLQV